MEAFSKEGVTRLRRWLLLISGLFSGISLLLLSQDPSTDCPSNPNLRFSLWLAFSVQLSSFLLLLLHFIYLGFLLSKLGPWLSLYYVYFVGSFLAIQFYFFRKPDQQDTVMQVDCFKHSPGMYTWVGLQIFAFYFLVAYGLAMCGAYLCWEYENEEKRLKRAILDYRREREREQKRTLMLTHSKTSPVIMNIDSDKSEPLLQKQALEESDEENNVSKEERKSQQSEDGYQKIQ